MHWVHLWDSWVRSRRRFGRGAASVRALWASKQKAWQTAFIAAMHGRACQHAPGVVASLDLAGVSRVLDVGGGSGAYAMEFVRAKTGATAVIFDLPAVLPLTASYVKEAGLSARVGLVAGTTTGTLWGRVRPRTPVGHPPQQLSRGEPRADPEGGGGSHAFGPAGDTGVHHG